MYKCNDIWRFANWELLKNLTFIDTMAFSGYKEVQIRGLFSDTLTYIGKGAFSGCINLKINGNLPKSLKTIEDYVFTGCKHVTINGNLPIAITSIGVNAFSGCKCSWLMIKNNTLWLLKTIILTQRHKPSQMIYELNINYNKSLWPIEIKLLIMLCLLLFTFFFKKSELEASFPSTKCMFTHSHVHAFTISLRETKCINVSRRYVVRVSWTPYATRFV